MSAVSKEAKEHQRQYQKERYEWYKSHGICTRCLNAFSEPGRVYCEACKEKNMQTNIYYKNPERNKALLKERYRVLKENGMCVTCGKRKARPGKTQCFTCAKRQHDTQQARKLRERLQREASK